MVSEAESLVERSEHGPAEALASRAEALARSSGDRHTLARALSVLARCRHLRDEYPLAIQTALRAVNLWRELDDIAGESRVRAGISRMLLAIGETADALTEGIAALELSGADLRSRMTALTATGVVYLSLEQFDLSLTFCERAAETARLLGDEIANGALLDTLACVYLGMAAARRDAGDETEALVLFRTATSHSREAMMIARRLGNRRNEVTSLANLAEGLSLIGEATQALSLLESWRVDRARDSPYSITHLLDTRGSICMSLGHYAEAVSCFTQALALAEGPNAAVLFCEHLADAHERSGDLRAALAYYKRYHELFRQVTSETAQRNASVAAVRLETAEAKAQARDERTRAENLYRSNLELSRRAEDLLQQSLEDPLTGLANRRSVDRLLDGAVHEYTVVLIDVDHFKQVNDTFSHLAGDRVLRQLGQLLRACCREEDTAARYGGEEFMILLWHLPGYTAAAVAERVRATVQSFDWSSLAPQLAVTVSIGVAAGTERPFPTEVVALADQRLYAAKRAGRNRVIGPRP